ncbi:hypothetical protein ACWC9T_06495 [Kitasatospora sp. NPDC001159]
MTGHAREGGSAVTELLQVLSCIGPTCGDTVDWSAAERVQGHFFPADYRALAAAFGSGSIEQLVGTRIPAVSSGELPGNTVSGISEEHSRTRR